MANERIEEIAADGQHTEDHVYREQIVRELLYTQAGNLSVGTQLVGDTTFNTLDVKFNYPGDGSAQYPVAQDATVSRDRFNWQEFDMTLRRGQARYFINDSAKIRGVGDMQQNLQSQASGEAMARRKDENILGTLADGAISENEENDDPWDLDESNGGRDIVEAFHEMWSVILRNAPLNNLDVENFGVVLPIEIWTELNQVELINNVQQQLNEYLGQTFGFSMYPTKLGLHEDDEIDLQNTVIMMIPGDDTAIHGVLDEDTANAAGVPLVESERKTGQGEEYLVSQWFNTRVLEHEAGGSEESPRIAVRTGVNSNYQ